MKNCGGMTPIWQMAATEITYVVMGLMRKAPFFANDNDIDGENELNWYFSLTSTIFPIETMISIGDSYLSTET